MAGHSKWANIKHRKQALDLKRAAVYTQLSKEISVAARLEGTDIAYNFRLRNAVERAKQIGMPNDNIERAIEKAKNSHHESFEEIIYEGYGPNGIAVLVSAATNNRNRTAAELRTVFGKYAGNLGETGCVNWGFKHLALILIPRTIIKNEELLFNLLDECELENFELEEDPENYLLFASISKTEKTVTLIKTKINYNCSAEIAYWPDNLIELKDELLIEKVESLIEKLENLDDVQKVFHNALLTN
jgi:YebC/PmpR family DNA-binding regulatory protein